MIQKDTYSKLLRVLCGKVDNYSTEEIVEIYELAIKQKVQYYLPDDFDKKLGINELLKKKLYHKDNKNTTCNTLNIISTIYEECNKIGINFFVIKGPILSYLIYSDFSKRMYSDIDIIVSDEDYLEFCFILEKSGFYNRFAVEYQDYEFADHETKSQIYKQLNYNDCAFYHKNKKMRGLEIKTQIRECNFEMTNELISNYIKIDFDNYSLKTLNINNTFICILLNLYFFFESRVGVIHKSKLKDIFDVLSFYKKYKEQINFNYVKDFAEKYNIMYKIHFSLLLVNQTFEFSIPKDIVSLFERSINKRMIDIKQRLISDNFRFENYMKNIIVDSINRHTALIAAKKVPWDYDFENVKLEKSFILFRTFNSKLLNLLVSYDIYVKGDYLCFVVSIPQTFEGYTILINFYNKNSLLEERKIAILRYNRNKIIFGNYIKDGNFEFYNNGDHRYVVLIKSRHIAYYLNDDKYGTVFSIKMYKIITNDFAFIGAAEEEDKLSVLTLDA